MLGEVPPRRAPHSGHHCRLEDQFLASPPGRPWDIGADSVSGDAIDRICVACRESMIVLG